MLLNFVYLALPYPVDDANGHAKFDKSRRELVVTLPVLAPEIPYHINEVHDKTCDNNNTEPENNDLNLQTQRDITKCTEDTSRDCNSKDKSVELNEMVNGVHSETVSNTTIQNDTETLESTSTEGFVLMDDIIQVDQTNEGLQYTATELNAQDLELELTSDLSGNKLY